MNQHDIFWLAHYAYNTINPVIEDLKAIEPSASFDLRLKFNDPNFTAPTHLDIWSRWDVEPRIIEYTLSVTGTKAVNDFAAKLRKLADTLRADICKGCDRHVDDEEYGRDENCETCFQDPTPQNQWEVTAPTSPEREFEAEYHRG